MASTLYPRTGTTTPLVTPYKNHLVLHALNSGSGTASVLDASTVDTAPNERQMTIGNVPAAADVWSGPNVTQHTQTGTVTFTVYGKLAVADADLRLRARLFKMTAGGSDVETPMVTADATVSLTTTLTQYTLSASLPTAITLVPGERLILRFYVFPFTGGWGSGSPVASVSYDATLQPTSLSLPVTATFANNEGPLYWRRTQTVGIADFLDMVTARGALGAISNDVLSQAGGTEIQWTRPKQVGSIAVTEITAAVIASTSNVATYASATFTPVANRLYLLAVLHTDTAPEATIPTVATTTGLNFVFVGTSAFNTIASNTHRLSLFRAMKASGLSAGTYTVTLADAGTGCAALLAEVTGVDTSGTDGANAITAFGSTSADASANPTATPNVAGRPIDGMFACFGSSIQTAPTAGTGFTALSNPDYATPSAGLFAEYSTTTQASASCTLASSAWAAIPVNLVADSTPVGLAWISPRFKAGWAVETANQFAWKLSASESLLSANCAGKVKVFRYQPDGTETLLYTLATPELPADPSALSSTTGGTVTPTPCAEDDRLIVRVYIANVGTMGGGATCSVWYDANAADGVGDSYLTFVGLPEWKAEGDPPAPPKPPTAIMTGGVG